MDRSAIDRLADDRFRATFVDLCSRHRVLGLVLSRLTGADMRDGVPAVDEFDRLLRPLRRRAMIFEAKRDHLAGVLQARGIETVILKGAALATTIYREPVERDLADLDLLVRPTAIRPAVRAFAEEGYSLPPQRGRVWTYRRHHFHLPLSHPDGHVVEVHWALSRPGSPFGLGAGAILDQAVAYRPLAGPGQRHPRPEHMILHLALQNLREGFSRLARLVDMDRIIASQPDLDWSALTRIACNEGLASPAALSLRLLSRLFGIEVPEEAARALRPSAVSRAHLAMLRPEHSLLTQRSERTYSAKSLLELWLLRGTRSRASSLLGMLKPKVRVAAYRREIRGWFGRCLKLGKVIIFQLSLYASAAAAQLTRSGRDQMRFWSSQASSSERL